MAGNLKYFAKHCNASVPADVYMNTKREVEEGDAMCNMIQEDGNGACGELTMDRRSFLRVGAAAFCGVVVLPLAACGGSLSGSSSSSSAEKSASAAFEECGVWFVRWSTDEPSDPIAKDDSVSEVLDFKDGKVARYSFRSQQIEFGDLDGKSEDEIISMANDAAKSHFEELLQSQISDIKVFLSRAQEEGKSELAEVYSEKLDKLESLEYEEPEPVEYELAVTTDDSGNETVSESITLPIEYLDSYEYYGGRYGDTGSDDPFTQSTDTVEFAAGNGEQTVYDTTFVGYDMLVAIAGDGDATSYVLDSPDTKGVEVD